jgi:hypothetical protein
VCLQQGDLGTASAGSSRRSGSPAVTTCHKKVLRLAGPRLSCRGSAGP